MSAPEPSELIYAPQPTWAPLLVAAGIAGAIAGLFTWWAFTAVALFAIAIGLRSWVGLADREVSEMRRTQEIDTAVIPAEPIRRPSADRTPAA